MGERDKPKRKSHKDHDSDSEKSKRRPTLERLKFKSESSKDKKDDRPKEKKPFKKSVHKRKRIDTESKDRKPSPNAEIRLNKYIAHSGICSRREADTLISEGKVKVNDKVITVLGTKIKRSDKVTVSGKPVSSEKKVYVLLNKPKDFITTVDDPQGRRTVMELVSKACRERIYPVGRLDRMTTGLLLFTNDGDLTKKLTHPSSEISKLYHVTLDRPMDSKDLETLEKGITLEDGFIKPDAISFGLDGANKQELGIELHSGKNRIVRRMIESLDYKVIRLDRVLFAGLSKKNLPRGRYRVLSEEEVARLHML